MKYMERTSGWLECDTMHSLERAKTRADQNRKQALRQMELARKRGVKEDDCTWSDDKTFLKKHSNEVVEAIAYNGYCYIFDRVTNYCITMYKLPRHFGKKKTYYRTAKSREINFLLDCI